MALALAHDGAQHGVEARAVAAAGEHTNTHVLSLRADQIAATASIVGVSWPNGWLERMVGMRRGLGFVSTRSVGATAA
jgi:hypothetical protein